MTDEQAKEVAATLTTERVAELLREHWQLKQCLCAQVLGVPTGAEDWISRAIARGDHLRNCEHSLRQTIAGITKLAEDADFHTSLRYCTNCMGRKTINGESCVICHGTGRSKY